MSETINIGDIATALSRDVFKHFLWSKHGKHDDNFACGNPEHTGESKDAKPKDTHPGDVVFHYAEKNGLPAHRFEELHEEEHHRPKTAWRVQVAGHDH
ncbi:hypothetical protein [Cupriavidus sp. CuC1]|uniref:hypothetical protein n=1 Tax=Cupriavidus sp. CuC1 TaxID=3373131 RepID=UPI0037D78996